MSLYHYIVPALLGWFCLTACSGDSGKQEQQQGTGPSVPAGLDDATEMKFKQYWTHGRRLYKQHCIGCHQNDGSGLAQLIPPLAGADFLENRERVICIIKHGQQGEVVVNGITYDGVMPASPQLQALDIAEIATYILNAWGNEGGFVSVQQADSILNTCPEKQ
ncbi:cytochrome c [Cesiribacter sp. SM1]|uniref:c-type cytochrome n=1 Tax=Cesiribacter sp. SM1 TaxID=2861196 RepID=UPI001CD6B326|nr:cytochrome c [Cesiribacter sp. SM1]